MRIVFEGMGKKRKYYDSQHNLWCQQMVPRDLTFQVENAGIFTILGCSGAGKSTLLRLVNRLQDPSQGHIMLDGRLVSSGDVNALWKDVGMVWQLPAFPQERYERMSSMNPDFVAGRQAWMGLPRPALPRWGCPRICWAGELKTCLVASSNESAWPEPWPTGSRFCSRMSPPQLWTSRPPWPWSGLLVGWLWSESSPFFSSLTT